MQDQSRDPSPDRLEARLSAAREAFAAGGFAVLPQALAPSRLAALAHAFRAAEADKRITPRDSPATDRVDYYGVDLFEQLLFDMIGLIKQVVGAALWPSYSYVRTYKRGADLRPHRDRPACEITVSLTLATSLTLDWPIILRQRCGRPQALVAGLGDVIVFQGTELEHWRDPLDGDWHVQVFLHYVRRDGPNAHFMFDRGRNLRMAKPAASGKA